jgi:hypothetical protein
MPLESLVYEAWPNGFVRTYYYVKPGSFFHPKYFLPDTYDVSSCATPCRCLDACPIEARGPKLLETKQPQEPEHLSTAWEFSPRLENGNERSRITTTWRVHKRPRSPGTQCHSTTEGPEFFDAMTKINLRTMIRCTAGYISSTRAVMISRLPLIS